MDKFLFNLISGGNSNQGSNQNQGNWTNSPNPYDTNPTNPYQGNTNQNAGGALVIRTKLSGRSLDVSQSNDWGNQKGDLIIYDYLGAAHQQWNVYQDG